MISALFGFLIDIVLTGTVLWIAARLTSVDLRFKAATFSVAASGIAASVLGVLVGSFLGWILSICVLYFFLKAFTRASIWPDLVLMVLVSKVLVFVAGLLLL